MQIRPSGSAAEEGRHRHVGILGGGGGGWTERARSVGQRSLFRMTTSWEFKAWEEAGRKKSSFPKRPGSPRPPCPPFSPGGGMRFLLDPWIWPQTHPLHLEPGWGGGVCRMNLASQGFFLQFWGLFGDFLFAARSDFLCPSHQAAAKCQRPKLPEPQPWAGDGPRPPLLPALRRLQPSRELYRQ